MVSNLNLLGIYFMLFSPLGMRLVIALVGLGLFEHGFLGMRSTNFTVPNEMN